MKRLCRIAYRLLAALSMMLLLATAGVWVRSYWVAEKLTWDNWAADSFWVDRSIVFCSRGGVRFSYERWYPPDFRSRIFLPVSYKRSVSYEHGAATHYPTYGAEYLKDFSLEPQRHSAVGFEWILQSKVLFRQFRSETILSSLTLPLYFPTLLFAILPAHAFLRLRRRRRITRRIEHGCCIACGYDMRATPGRCPECGIIEAKGVL